MHSGFTRQSACALAAICLSSLMFGLEISSIPAILPTLEQALPANFSELQWIMNAYTIAVTTVLMATGTLADRYGRKRMFLGAIAAFGLTSLLCGLAANALVLIIARFLQGMSGGAMLICQVAILSHQFSDARQRSIAFGWWGIIFGIGLGFGPIIGGGIAALLRWEWVFLVHAPLSIATLLLAAGGVRESRDPIATGLDLPGILTLSLCVFCVAFYITQGPALGFGSFAGLAILGSALASLVAFLITERVSARPMFDFSVFRIRAFTGALLGSMAMNFSFWPFMIYLPIYFQAGLGYDSVTAGLSLLAYTLPALVVPPFAERLSLRFQPAIVIPAGLFTIGLGFALMKAGSSVGNPTWATLLPGCLLSGIGLGLTNTPVTNTTTAAVPGDRVGMASGIDMSARMIALAVNIALMGLLLLEGIKASLRNSLGEHAGAVIQSTAEAVAAGHLIPSGETLSGPLLREALTRGFGWMMLYGCFSAWLLAGASYLVFGRAARNRAGNALHETAGCQSSPQP